MSEVKLLLEEWSRLLALPNPKILHARPFQPSFYEWTGRQHRIHVRLCFDQAELAFHELGHFFLEVHYGKLVPAKTFKRLFGDRCAPYDSLLLSVPGLRNLPANHYGFVSLYAEVHPEEDWAETFAKVMMSFHENEDLPEYDDEELNEKMAFILAIVEKAFRKSAG